MARGNFNFSLTIDPSPATLAEMYVEIADQVTDLSGLWAELAPKLAAGLAANLAGGKFESLSKDYLARKVRAGFGRQTLVRTGATFAKLAGAEIVASGKTFLRTGLGEVEYEHAINYGAMRGGDNLLKPRKFFWLTTAMGAAFVEAVRQHIDDVLEAASIKLEQAPKIKVLAR